jgi:TonB-dependent starch-binding outer membrane protein SusC
MQTLLRSKRIRENHIFNKKGLVYLLFMFLQINFVFSQRINIQGNIKDNNGVPLIGASVLNATTSEGTVTDVDGNYSIGAAIGNVLVYSIIGHKSQEITVTNTDNIDLVLEEDSEVLDQVVVVGYGVQKKSDLTGAVSVVNTKEMLKQATNDITQMMQGRVAGVAITTDGQPGAAPTVRVRGVSTFGLGSSAEPLYVVDGFPLPGGIRDLNPNDVESIQVLKDATSGAIYGNRAANGVIIITTKKGKKNEKFNVSFSTYLGSQTVGQRLPVLDRAGYQAINSELLTNAGQPLVAGNNPASNRYINNIDTDWQDAGYKDGGIQNYNLNFNGGSKNTSYFMSFDVLNNTGTLVGTGPDYKRYSMRVNSETQIGRLKFGENIYVVRSDENPLFFTSAINLPGGRPTLVNDLLQAAPTIPVLDPNREGGYGGADAVVHQSITLNVPGFNSLVQNTTDVNRLLANAYGELDLGKGLSYKLNFQYDNSSIADQLFVPKYDLGYFFPGPVAQLQNGSRNASSYLVENTMNYKKVFGKHDISLLAGQSYQDFKFREVRTVGSGLEKPYILGLGSASTFSVLDNQQPSVLASYLGRLNYSFNDKYLLTANFRYDGSSRFRKENRFALFPSIGVAWKLHNELNLPAAFTELKLRGGFGQLGNQEIGNFRYQSTINRAIPYEFGTGRVLGAATTILVDPSIQWEKRTTRNVGVDAVLWDGKLEFTGEYYSNVSNDVLIDLPIPLSNGSLAGLTTNAGSIKNSGIELSSTIRKNFGGLALEISPNFYTVKNEVTEIGTLDFISGAGARTEVGEAIGQHYGWVYDGIFQTKAQVESSPFQNANTNAGDVKFKDLNADNVINEKDRQYLGSGMPTHYYGLNVVAKMKGFDFTVFGQGSGGNLINSNLYKGLMATTGYTNWHEDILNRWTPTNTATDVPRVVWNDPNNNNRDSDRPGWLQSGDYFRINTVSLGYTLDNALLKKVKMQGARIYATLQNVKTFSSYKGYNPDFQAGILNPGFDFGTYPRPQTTMVGLQINL